MHRSISRIRKLQLIEKLQATLSAPFAGDSATAFELIHRIRRKKESRTTDALPVSVNNAFVAGHFSQGNSDRLNRIFPRRLSVVRFVQPFRKRAYSLTTALFSRLPENQKKRNQIFELGDARPPATPTSSIFSNNYVPFSCRCTRERCPCALTNYTDGVDL